MYQNRKTMAQNANNSPQKGNCCDTRQIIAITKINDCVMVMYDDCSFTRANINVVDINLLGDKDTLKTYITKQVEETIKDSTKEVEDLESVKLFRAYIL